MKRHCDISLMNVNRFYTLWFHNRRKIAMKKFILGISGKRIRILDIGSGIGVFNKIFRQIGFKKIVAVDFNRKLLRMNDAEEKIIINLENKLPFSNNYFDCCFATEIIEHLEKREQLLTEVFRVLKPNGYLVLTTPNRNSLIAKFDRIIRRFVVNGQWNGHDYEHKYVYSFNEIKRMVEKTGFKIIKIETFYLFYGLPMLLNSSLGMCTWIFARKI